MKKQLLIAAVAASMTSVAMADISISGSSKANVVDGATAIEADLNITGKSGDSSVVANLSLDTNTYEDLYMTSSFEGVNIKVGNYRSGKSELDVTTAATARYNLSTTMAGVTATYEATAASHDLTLGGTVAGVSVKHKMKQNKDTETWISGSMSGVNVAWNQEKDDSASANNTALTVSTEVSGVTATYIKVDSDAGTVMDGFFGKKIAGSEVSKATGFALATSVAGNTVTFKSLDVDSADSSKVIINRALASGATFEAVYTNNDASKNTLDLELAVKF